jgi:hypothetical protein
VDKGGLERDRPSPYAVRQEFRTAQEEKSFMNDEYRDFALVGKLFGGACFAE